MHAKYEVSISYGLKVIARVKVDNRQTNKQANKPTDRQTDRTKTICPRSFDPGALKKSECICTSMFIKTLAAQLLLSVGFTKKIYSKIITMTPVH